MNYKYDLFLYFLNIELNIDCNFYRRFDTIGTLNSTYLNSHSPMYVIPIRELEFISMFCNQTSNFFSKNSFLFILYSTNQHQACLTDFKAIEQNIRTTFENLTGIAYNSKIYFVLVQKKVVNFAFQII